MIIPVAALFVLAVPVILGGSVTRMARVRLRGATWLFAALAVQVLIVELLTGPVAVLQAAHIGTYVVAAWFVAVNLRVPGVGLVGLGALSNGLVILINGGTLPARAGALRAAGLAVAEPGFVNSGVLANPRLAWLGDVFALPQPLPLANVFSVGDVLVIAGVAVASWRICGTRWTRPWVPPRHRVQARASLREVHRPGAHAAAPARRVPARRPPARRIPAQRRAADAQSAVGGSVVVEATSPRAGATIAPRHENG
jgi:hypothetical protein